MADVSQNGLRKKGENYKTRSGAKGAGGWWLSPTSCHRLPEPAGNKKKGWKEAVLGVLISVLTGWLGVATLTVLIGQSTCQHGGLAT